MHNDGILPTHLDVVCAGSGRLSGFILVTIVVVVFVGVVLVVVAVVVVVFVVAVALAAVPDDKRNGNLIFCCCCCCSSCGGGSRRSCLACHIVNVDWDVRSIVLRCHCSSSSCRSCCSCRSRSVPQRNDGVRTGSRTSQEAIIGSALPTSRTAAAIGLDRLLVRGGGSVRVTQVGGRAAAAILGGSTLSRHPTTANDLLSIRRSSLLALAAYGTTASTNYNAVRCLGSLCLADLTVAWSFTVA
mmetsp:Transcript_27515/g.59784  ORF Transcript_27515/g.59784 Transcript_27515/m.59784 type:complete len:243 (-) Transcript_27515:467-1195(-)